MARTANGANFDVTGCGYPIDAIAAFAAILDGVVTGDSIVTTLSSISARLLNTVVVEPQSRHGRGAVLHPSRAGASRESTIRRKATG
jgi:hypothetical protein